MDLAGKRVTVMGLGRFGGGVGVTRWLARNGADVLVTDLDGPDDLSDSLDKIRDLIDRGQVSLRLGGHNVADFTATDLVIANPAVPKPWDNRFLRAAEAAGVAISTEISLFVERLPFGARERTVGITGSVGKSTTAAMVHHALAATLAAGSGGRPAAGRVLLGGNIGGSLLDELPTIDDRTWVVLELSSFMLHWLGRTAPGFSPHVAVVTNLSANHLDWHGGLAHYAASKQVLLRSQQRHDTAILGGSVTDWASLTPARPLVVDPGEFLAPLRLPGDHNRVNAAAALLAATAAAPELDPAALAAAVGAFGGLPHRLQLVTEQGTGAGEPIRFYNDSKSTTPESCLRAVEALSTAPGIGARRIHLIAGGYDKGSDLAPIAAAARDLAGLYTIGATGPAIAAAALERGAAPERVHDCGTLDAAVAAAHARLAPGDALLLSPGCASWDQFTNFEQRGDRFVSLVTAATFAPTTAVNVGGRP